MPADPDLEAYRSSVRVIGTVTLVVGVLWLFGVLLFATVGTLGGLGILNPHESAGDRLAGIGGSALVGLYCAAGAAVNMVAGSGLRRLAPWSRGAGIAAAVLDILGGCGCVVGLALGIWMLVVLLDSRAARAFAPAG
ncbi:MAG: hypothetical protein HYZ29_30930 [Myxococcales bacterium]|nr:hypothetical protein [Myxococcales bacterium]